MTCAGELAVGCQERLVAELIFKLDGAKNASSEDSPVDATDVMVCAASVALDDALTSGQTRAGFRRR